MIKHCVEKRLLFSEADPAGIAQFHMMFAWIQETEQSFFRSLGIPVPEYWGVGGKEEIGWARQHASLDFVRPIVVDEEFRVCLELREMTQRSFTFDVVIESAIEVKAKGMLKTVCVQGRGNHFKAIPIPGMVRNKFQQRNGEPCSIEKRYYSTAPQAPEQEK